MSTPIPWMKTLGELRDVNSSLRKTLLNKDWELISHLQDEKQRLMESLDASMRGSKEFEDCRHKALQELAQQEGDIYNLLAAATADIKTQLHEIEVSRGISRRIRSSYGNLGPSSSYWEHFS